MHKDIHDDFVASDKKLNSRSTVVEGDDLYRG
jgi:hypothetical protein